MKSNQATSGTPLGGDAPSKAPAPPPTTGFETNPVLALLDMWRTFRESPLYKWLSVQNARESALPLAAVIVGLLVLTFFSPLELVLLFTFLAILSGGVLKLTRRFAPQLNVPEPSALVDSAVSPAKVKAVVENCASFLSSHVSSATYVFGWEDSLFSVRVAAVAWLCYRWSFLLAPGTALTAVIAVVGSCSVIHHVVRDTSSIENILRSKAAPAVRRFINSAAATFEKVTEQTQDNAPVIIGVGISLTAFTLFTLRHVIPFFSSVSLVTCLILAHWVFDVARPKRD